MSYQTNLHDIAAVISVYGQDYGLLMAFDNYPELTVMQYRMLPESQRKARVDAFYQMLNAMYGHDIEYKVEEGSEDRRANPDSCPLADFYTIEATSSHGTVTGNGLYQAGEVVTLDSEPDIPRPFLGWFLGDVLLYSQKPWIFPATGDLKPEARYDEVVAIPVTATSDDHSKVGLSITGPWDDIIAAEALVGGEVQFFVRADSGYQIDRWENGNGDVVSNNLSCVVVASEEDENLNKVFVHTKEVPLQKYTLVNIGLTGSYTISQDGYVTDPLAKRWLGGSDIVLDESVTLSNEALFSFNRPLYVRNMATGQQQLIPASQVVPNGSANITV